MLHRRAQVKAFKCSCGSLTETRRADCAARGHSGGVTNVVKRFFACREGLLPRGEEHAVSLKSLR